MKSISIVLSIILIGGIASCAKVQKRDNLVQSTNSILTSGVGEVVYKIEKSRDMPNAFGNADLFGREVGEGF